MNYQYILYGLVIGLTPLIVGLMIAKVAPHSPGAQLPWLTMVSLPIGLLGGIAAALFT
jgi:hypothetical protein